MIHLEMADKIKMKHVACMIVFVVVIAFLSVLTAAPIVNDHVAKKTAEELAGLPLPDSTEFIEMVYQAGKLVGNGNRMQYFGAALIKSELSLEEIKEYYSKYAENEWEYVVEKQTDKNVKIIEHAELTFKTDIEGDDYYIVYSWGVNNTIFHEFDIRGH